MAEQELTPEQQAALDAQNSAGGDQTGADGTPAQEEQATDAPETGDEGEMSDEEKRVELNTLADELGLLVVEPGTLDAAQLEFVLGRLTEGTGAQVFYVHPDTELTEEQKLALLDSFSTALGFDPTAKAPTDAEGESVNFTNDPDLSTKVQEIRNIIVRTAASPRAAITLIKPLVGLDS